MRKILKLLPLFFISTSLVSCTFGSDPDFSIEAYYYLKDGSTSDESQTISYGESFDIKDKEYLVYKNTSLGKTLLKPSQFTVSYSEGGEENIFSDTPEISNYYILIEHKGKSKSFYFQCHYASEFPSNVSLYIPDSEVYENAPRPQLVNCVDNITFSYSSGIIVKRYIDEDIFDVGYSYPYRDGANLKMDLEPGLYYAEGTFYTDHYSDASLSTTFRVSKGTFPSDSFSVRYSISKNFHGSVRTGDYSFYNVYLYDKDGNPVNKFNDGAALTFKNPDEAISSSKKTYRVIYSSKYFEDYEFDIELTFTRVSVEKPSITLDDYFSKTEVTYDGNEHQAKLTMSSDYYYIDEDRSILSATNAGTYQIYIVLSNKEFLYWKGNGESTDDIVLEWTIKRADYRDRYSGYQLYMGDTEIKYEYYQAKDNVFDYVDVIDQPFNLKFILKDGSGYETRPLSCNIYPTYESYLDDYQVSNNKIIYMVKSEFFSSVEMVIEYNLLSIDNYYMYPVRTRILVNF